MATFTIDSENKITGYAPGEAVPEGSAERFTTEGELAELAAQWPGRALSRSLEPDSGADTGPEVHQLEDGGSETLEGRTNPNV